MDVMYKYTFLNLAAHLRLSCSTRFGYPTKERVGYLWSRDNSTGTEAVAAELVSRPTDTYYPKSVASLFIPKKLSSAQWILNNCVFFAYESLI